MRLLTQRLALQYRPPMLVIEYAVLSECGSKKLYQHDISLEVPLRCIYDMSESLNAGAGITSLADKLRVEHAHVCGHGQISTQQLVRMLKMLYNALAEEIDSEKKRSRQLTPELPCADYNNVSEAQLVFVKNRMDTAFQRHEVRPGDDNYVYDKRIVYDSVQTPSDWDDEI
ncbi:hypothetical protein ABG067_001304 [Albugo candida]